MTKAEEALRQVAVNKLIDSLGYHYNSNPDATTLMFLAATRINRLEAKVKELESDGWTPISEIPDENDTSMKLCYDAEADWKGSGIAEWNFGWCDQISRKGQHKWVTMGMRPITHYRELPNPPRSREDGS